MKGNHKVELTCSCGKIFAAWAHNIRLRGHTKKCSSCRRTEVLFKRFPPYTALYNQLKRESIRRGIGLALTFEEFLAFTEVSRCFYCDAVLDWQSRGTHKRGVSGYNLDRKDTTGIYEKTNLVQCCGICNRIKSDRFTFEQMCSLAPTLKALNIQISKFQEN
jgi:hypothetical protein